MAGVAVGLTLGGTTAQAQDRAVNLVMSGTVDLQAGSVTLPLHMGRMGSGENVWYVLLDTSDRDTAARLGINWSGKLSNAGIGRAVREAEISPDGELVFDSGTVDFLPERRAQPGPDGAPFPPAVAMPGSVGDEDYSPLVRVTNAGGHIFNAPVVAFDVEGAALDRFCGGDPDHALVHDKVVRICPRDGTVTLQLTSGFSGGKHIEYISSEANVALVAALEGATFAPRLSDVPADQGDAAWSAVEPIYVVINGVTGASETARQGLTSALADGFAAQRDRRCADPRRGLQPALGLPSRVLGRCRPRPSEADHQRGRRAHPGRGRTDSRSGRRADRVGWYSRELPGHRAPGLERAHL